MVRRLLLCLILLSFVPDIATANTDELPRDQFQIKGSSNWKIIENNSDATVLNSKISSKGDVVVLRVFKQTANQNARKLAFQNEINKINEARNRFYQLLNIGYSQILEVNNIKLKNGANGIEIESVFTNNTNKKIRVFERQYFINGKIFQTTYLAYENTSSEKIKSSLNAFTPKGLRFPASHSELAESNNSSQRIHRINDTDVGRLLLMPEPKFNERYCSQVSIDQRRQPLKSLKDRYNVLMEGHSLAALGGCMHGVWTALKQTLVGLKDLTVGAYKYATDSVMREQTNAALTVVWGEFTKDKTQFMKTLVSNIYSQLVDVSQDFLCMNPVLQSEMICKVAGYFLPPSTMLFKIISKAKLTASELKKLSSVAERAAREIAEVEKDQLLKAPEKVVIETPKSPLSKPAAKPLLRAGRMTSLKDLKKDFPLIKNPTNFAEEVAKRKEAWKKLHPDDPDNYPMPEDKTAFDEMKIFLRGAIKYEKKKDYRSEYSDLTEHRFREALKEIHEIDKAGYPNKRSIEFAFKIVRLVSGKGTGASVDLTGSLKAIPDKVLVLTMANLSKESTAQMNLFNIFPIEISGKQMIASSGRFSEDAVTIGLSGAKHSPVTTLKNLPAEKKIEILKRIDDISDKRKKELVSWSLYHHVHFGGPTQKEIEKDIFVKGRGPTVDDYIKRREELLEMEYANYPAREKPMTREESKWLLQWTRKNIFGRSAVQTTIDEPDF